MPRELDLLMQVKPSKVPAGVEVLKHARPWVVAQGPQLKVQTLSLRTKWKPAQLRQLAQWPALREVELSPDADDTATTEALLELPQLTRVVFKPWGSASAALSGNGFNALQFDLGPSDEDLALKRIASAIPPGLPRKLVIRAKRKTLSADDQRIIAHLISCFPEAAEVDAPGYQGPVKPREAFVLVWTQAASPLEPRALAALWRSICGDLGQTYARWAKGDGSPQKALSGLDTLLAAKKPHQTLKLYDERGDLSLTLLGGEPGIGRLELAVEDPAQLPKWVRRFCDVAQPLDAALYPRGAMTSTSELYPPLLKRGVSSLGWITVLRAHDGWKKPALPKGVKHALTKHNAIVWFDDPAAFSASAAKSLGAALMKLTGK